MKKITLFLFAMIIGPLSFAQITDLGIPLGWKGNLHSDKDIPLEVLRGYDYEQIEAEDALNDNDKSIPWRFGYNYATDISLENSGLWTDLASGGRLWQVKITCPDAQSINLLISNLFLPAGAHLTLYDIDRTNRVGAYTSRNNRTDGLLGTELVHGDEIIVEYFEPSKLKGQGTMTISSVIHGYRSLTAIQERWERDLNESGDCNIDVNCPLGDGWENQISAVAMIVVDGSGICSGTLVNNTCNDGTPYFLTADHCLGETGFWAFRFNWESPEGTEVCASTALSVDPGADAAIPYDQTANGATILANSDTPDFALLLIDNMTLSDAELWGCFYAGWDNSDEETVTEGTGIHHTSGDVKKICREDDAPFKVLDGGQEFWRISDWDQGVTEPGSSGSALFDQNGRVIGQLCCGSAACSGTEDNDQLDYYGRFGYAWDLLDIGQWLAPEVCGDAVIDDGWEADMGLPNNDAGALGISVPNGGTGCSKTFVPQISIRNYGGNDLTSATILYNVDGSADLSYNWTGLLETGEIALITLPELTVEDGEHVFNLKTNEPNGETDSNPANDLIDADFSVFANGVSITLALTVDCFGSEVTWEILNEDDDVMVSGGPYSNSDDGGTVYERELCLPNGCYDFVLSDSYGDGMAANAFCLNRGDYTISYTGTGEILASMLAEDADFGDEEINNFCIEVDNSGLGEERLLFSVYPNPSEGVFNIFVKNQENISVQVYDMTGKLIYTRLEVNAASFSINLSDKSEGIYLLKLTSDSGEVMTHTLKNL